MVQSSFYSYFIKLIQQLCVGVWVCFYCVFLIKQKKCSPATSSFEDLVNIAQENTAADTLIEAQLRPPLDMLRS